MHAEEGYPGVELLVCPEGGRTGVLRLSHQEVADFILELLEARGIAGGEEITFHIPHQIPNDGMYVARYTGTEESRIASVIEGEVLVVTGDDKARDETQSYRRGSLTLTPIEVV